LVKTYKSAHLTDTVNLHASPNIIRIIKSKRMRWEGYVANMGEMKNTYKILVRKPEEKRPLRRPSHRWENIRMGVRQTDWKGIDWIHLPQERDGWWALVNMVMNIQLPQRQGVS
jgi:hypothetical protein